MTISADFLVYRSAFIRIVITLGAIDLPACVKLCSQDPSNSHSSGRFPGLVLQSAGKIYAKRYGLTEKLLLAFEGTAMRCPGSHWAHYYILLTALGAFRTPFSLTPYKRVSLVILSL